MCKHFLRTPPRTVLRISYCYSNHWLCFHSALSIILVGNGEKRTKLANKLEKESRFFEDTMLSDL